MKKNYTHLTIIKILAIIKIKIMTNKIIYYYIIYYTLIVCNKTETKEQTKMSTLIKITSITTPPLLIHLAKNLINKESVMNLNQKNIIAGLSINIAYYILRRWIVSQQNKLSEIVIPAVINIATTCLLNNITSTTNISKKDLVMLSGSLLLHVACNLLNDYFFSDRLQKFKKANRSIEYNSTLQHPIMDMINNFWYAFINGHLYPNDYILTILHKSIIEKEFRLNIENNKNIGNESIINKEDKNNADEMTKLGKEYQDPHTSVEIIQELAHIGLNEQTYNNLNNEQKDQSVKDLSMDLVQNYDGLGIPHERIQNNELAQDNEAKKSNANVITQLCKQYEDTQTTPQEKKEILTKLQQELNLLCNHIYENYKPDRQETLIKNKDLLLLLQNFIENTVPTFENKTLKHSFNYYNTFPQYLTCSQCKKNTLKGIDDPTIEPTNYTFTCQKCDNNNRKQQENTSKKSVAENIIQIFTTNSNISTERLKEIKNIGENTDNKIANYQPSSTDHTDKETYKLIAGDELVRQILQILCKNNTEVTLAEAKTTLQHAGLPLNQFTQIVCQSCKKHTKTIESHYHNNNTIWECPPCIQTQQAQTTQSTLINNATCSICSKTTKTLYGKCICCYLKDFAQNHTPNSITCNIHNQAITIHNKKQIYTGVCKGCVNQKPNPQPKITVEQLPTILSTKFKHTYIIKACNTCKIGYWGTHNSEHNEHQCKHITE
jgi:hypothetical protein